MGTFKGQKVFQGNYFIISLLFSFLTAGIYAWVSWPQTGIINAYSDTSLHVMSCRTLTEQMNGYQFEVIYIDDVSKDTTLPRIRKLAEIRPYVRYIGKTYTEAKNVHIIS